MPVRNNATGHPARSPRQPQKVEIHLQQDGEHIAALKYSTYVEGLGWCCQKTIKLDAEQLDELHRALTVARHRVRRRRAEAGEDFEPARVIQLPTVA